MTLIFDVLNKDTLVSHVEIIDGKINIKRYVLHPGIQPFGNNDMDVNFEWINAFLESRCFDKNRPDKNEILEYLELDSYNTINIVKKTHGRILGDFTWIRFPNETLTWKDLTYEGI